MSSTINPAYENPYSALIRDYGAPGPVNGLAAKLAGPRVTKVVKPVAPKITAAVKPTDGNFLGMDETKKMLGSINNLDDANSAQKDYMAQDER